MTTVWSSGHEGQESWAYDHLATCFYPHPGQA
jgi:hypothetical protein